MIISEEEDFNRAYPAYSGPEEPAENPHSLLSKSFNMYNELESVENVTQVWERDDVDDCVLLTGTTIQPDIEKWKALRWLKLI